MEGFVVMDFCSRRAQAEAALARWLNEAARKSRGYVDGLENVPSALAAYLPETIAAS